MKDQHALWQDCPLARSTPLLRDGRNPYTASILHRWSQILKWAGHDEDTEAKTNDVHRNCLNQDLTQAEVTASPCVMLPSSVSSTFSACCTTIRPSMAHLLATPRELLEEISSSRPRRRTIWLNRA